MNIPVTYLTSYRYCKRKFYIEQVLGQKEPEKSILIKGKIKHNVLDLVNKQERGIVISIDSEDKEKILEKYNTTYSKNLKNTILIYRNKLKELGIEPMQTYEELWPLFKTEGTVHAENIHSFLVKHKVFGQQLWDMLTPKIESEVFIQSDNLELKGKIDRIEKYEDSMIPVEIKTGKAPREGVWEDHLIQTGAYMMLIEDKFGTVTKTGRVHYITHNIKRDVKMNPFLKEEIKKLVKEVQALLQSKEIPDLCNNQNKCASCGLKDYCNQLQTQ